MTVPRVEGSPPGAEVSKECAIVSAWRRFFFLGWNAIFFCFRLFLLFVGLREEFLEGGLQKHTYGSR